MSTEIKIFNNPRFGEIRTTNTEDGNPVFCLIDLCRTLGLDSSQVTRRLDDGVFSTHPIFDSLGRQQQANFVNEDGLYDVILDSRKPEAKSFRKWITSEVLPSIRKHGAYLTDLTLEKVLQDPSYMIGILTELQSERESKKVIEAEKELYRSISEHQTGVIEKMKPKEIFADSVATSESNCPVGEVGKILKQDGFSIGQNGLCAWFH